MSTELPQILCIDDDVQVLEGLKLSLRQLGEVHIAEGGEAALAKLGELPRLAVIICDMRMPGMNGDVVLGHCRERSPLAVRMLLTGYSDLDAAIRAVNTGHIFRFMNKPCPRDELHHAVKDALAQYRLVTAEKELLEKTVKGCMQALVEALAMASPASFGQARRIADLVQSVSARRGLDSIWASSMAAMLANLGLVGLPELLQQKVMSGLRLNANEQRDLTSAHQRTWAMLENIPRIEPVLELIAAIEPSLANKQKIPSIYGLADQAHVIRTVQSYVRLEASGLPTKEAMAMLATLNGDDDPVLQVLHEELGPQSDISRQLKLPINMLREGMVLMAAVHTPRGLLLAPSGYVVNDSFVDRLMYNCPEMADERISVLIPPEMIGYVHHQLQTRGALADES